MERERAGLVAANLREAYLREPNLREADLIGADLTGAEMRRYKDFINYVSNTTNKGEHNANIQ